MSLSREEWRTVAGYEGLYEVSNGGQVRSLDRAVRTWFGYRVVRGRTLRTRTRRDGYVQAGLSKCGRMRRLYVHRLVCAAFHGAQPSGYEARHLDGKREHNASRNLTWGTRVENQRDRVRHGTSIRGERAPGAKLTAQNVRAIRAASQGSHALAEQFGVSYSTVKAIRGGRIWKAA